jgi:hypothetical protein
MRTKEDSAPLRIYDARPNSGVEGEKTSEVKPLFGFGLADMASTATASLIFGLFPLGIGGQQPVAPKGPPLTSLVQVRSTFVIPEYDEKRAKNDLYLAQLFGGKNAVAAGNGFEPKNMWHNGVRQFRGNDNGRGHLDNSMHLYGSEDGNQTTELYIPRGGRYLGPMTSQNGRENGGHTFFYKKLGTEKNVYLLIFHVKDFKLDPKDRNSAGSLRIGNIGGPGGSPPDMSNPPKRNGKVALYLHAHLAIQKSPKGGTPGMNFSNVFPTPPNE